MTDPGTTTRRRRSVEDRGRRVNGDARARLLAGIPVEERRLELTGISTAVIEGGEGPPVVLLHGPGGNGAHWVRVIPDLVTSHRVLAPDLPGQGDSRVADGRLDADRTIAWLGELIERTCSSPPALVGFALGGAIAARFAADRGDALSRLVLVDALGLSPFEPTPGFGRALQGFIAQPSGRTHDDLWRQCAADLDGLRERMGERWEPFRAYNLDRARTPSVRTGLDALMGAFGVAPIPATDLARIAVPTTLIWGRGDLATPLPVAEAASADHGWRLRVIDACGDDPPVERPEAFTDALRSALADHVEIAAEA